MKNWMKPMVLSIFVVLTGCSQQKYIVKNLRDVHRMYPKVALIDCYFNSIMHVGVQENITNPLFHLGREAKLVAIEPMLFDYDYKSELTSEERVYIVETGQKLLEAFQKATKNKLNSGTDIIQNPAYIHLLSTTKQPKHVLPIPPYVQAPVLTPVTAKALARDLDVDLVAQVEIGFFYDNRKNTEEYINPLEAVDALGTLARLKNMTANRLGIYIKAFGYDREGELGLQAMLFYEIKRGKDFQIPGKEFHLYPEFREKIDLAVKLAVEGMEKYN